MDGNRLKLLRENAKLSQTELASRVGVSSAFIGQLEKNFKKPNADVLARFADEFKCSTDYLLGRE